MKKLVFLWGLFAAILITACEPAITGITISNSSLELEVGERATLTASIQPTGVKDVAIRWSSNNVSCVTVTNGVLEAKAAGTATITASAGEVSATCQVTVKPKSVKEVKLDKVSVDLYVGETVTLTATVNPPDAEYTIEWSSSNKNATVANGLVTAVEPGEAFITATAGGVSATCLINISVKPEPSITLDKKELTLEVGQQATIKATIHNPETPDQKPEWSSSSRCVTVADGVITAVEKGTATITASIGKASATCQVTVVGKSVQSLTLDKKELILEVDEEATLTATVLPEDADYTKIEWISTNNCVTVKDGVVKAVSKGGAYVRASIGDVSDVCLVSVIAKTVKSITLDKTELTLEVGETATLTATVHPADAEYTRINWSSDFKSIVSVDGGVLTAHSPGTSTIKASIDTVSATCEVTVVEPAFLARERAALIAIYNANNGPNWPHQHNWLSDKPVGEWDCVDTREDGHVVSLNLTNNQDWVYGYLPKEIADLTELEELTIQNNNDMPSGYAPLPEEIGQLSKLKWLNLQWYTISGKLPESLFNLSNLEFLYIVGNSHMADQPIPRNIKNLKSISTLGLLRVNFTGPLIPEIGELTSLTNLRLSNNKLTGSIPPEFGALINLSYIDLESNNLSGTIPSAVQNMDNYWMLWPRMVMLNDFNQEDLFKSGIPAPKSPKIQGLNGETIDLEEEFSKNTHTVLYNCDPDYGVAKDFLPQLAAFYNANKDKGLGVVIYKDSNKNEESEWVQEKARIKSILNQYGADWKSFFRAMYYDYPEGTSPLYAQWGRTMYPTGAENQVVIIGPDKTVEYFTLLDTSKQRLDNVIAFLENAFNNPISHYESSNYAADGKVTTLQTASTGKGVDLVITGDAFSDRQISNKTFENAAKQAVADLFSVEPMKSLKDRFNIYLVNAVSKHEEYFNGNSTAFSGVFGGGSAVGGDNAKVYEYARKAIGDDARMDNVTVLVLMNSLRDGGTTYMQDAVDKTVYAGGSSIAWIPYKNVAVSGGVSSLASTVVHEVAGHGIAKLADEYAYRDQGTISDAAVAYIKGRQSLNWYVNVDFTSDVNSVLWSRFAKDSNFAGENIGAYEGGYTFWKGVWRPTEQSVMNNNLLHNNFNAPSRAQIYTRIMKLSEGPAWNFDYNTFVAWDKAHPIRANRSAAPAAEHKHVAPVTTGKTWRETINNR